MSAAASKGREGALHSSPAGVQAGVQPGLAGQSGDAWKPTQDCKPEDSIPQTRGDVDKVTPRDEIGAAKQDMEQERGQRFTSATGEGITQRPGGNPMD